MILTTPRTEFQRPHMTFAASVKTKPIPVTNYTCPNCRFVMEVPEQVSSIGPTCPHCGNTTVRNG